MAAFVVQQHDASSLHYDFRLEVDGVLRSWAVPKGPSLDPRDKRLAMEVEDHPLSWGDFEGVISSGYCAGTVIVWDAGEWRPLTEGEPAHALRNGHLSFWLEGRKLRGGFTLRRTNAGAKPKWLLVKKRDAQARDDGDVVGSRPESVLSGRTIEQVAAGDGG